MEHTSQKIIKMYVEYGTWNSFWDYGVTNKLISQNSSSQKSYSIVGSTWLRVNVLSVLWNDHVTILRLKILTMLSHSLNGYYRKVIDKNICIDKYATWILCRKHTWSHHKLKRDEYTYILSKIELFLLENQYSFLCNKNYFSKTKHIFAN